MPRNVSTSLMAIAGVFVGLLAAVTSASASNLEVFGGQLSYNAFEALANTVTIVLSNGVYTLDDPAVVIEVGSGAVAAGCAAFDSNTVTCPATALTSLTVSTGSGDDTIELTNVAIPALLLGGTGADTLRGGAEDDTFRWNPGDGSDVLEGGGGTDTLEFNGANISEHIVIAADGAGFDLSRDVGNVRVTAQDVEMLKLTTQAGSDDVSTTNLQNTLQMIRAGNDLDTDGPDTLRLDGAGLCVVRVDDTFEVAGRQPIQFASFDDVFVTNAICRPDPCDGAVVTQGCTVNGVRDQPCQGTPGNDVITGTPGPDVIKGSGGDDRIKGNRGDDLLCGEAGDDLLVGGSGADVLVGGPGNNRLHGNSGDDRLRGGDDDDELFGDSGDDDLDGGAGSDALHGGGDADTLQGGPGLDLIDGGSKDDTCRDVDQLGPFPRCELP